MKRKTIKKLGIIIMSAMIAASPVVAPFTTMTVQASSTDIAEGDTVETNEGSVDYNMGTIETNEGSVQHNMGTIETNNNSVGANNSDGGKIETNNGSVANNFGSIVTNENIVVDNTGTITENNGTVTWNNVSFFGTGTITENNGDVKTNDGTITENNGNVEKNNGTIEHNYGNVVSNEGKIENNYNTVDGKGGQVGCGFGSVSNQWYEVKLENSEAEENPENSEEENLENSEENLENNETEVKIKGVETDSVKDINDSGNVDVFALGAASIIIYSINPSKIIDAVIESLECVKNDDGSVTINNIQKPLRLMMTSFADRILVKDSIIGPVKPNVEEPENPTPEPEEPEEEERVFTDDGGTIVVGESYDKNTASNVENNGTIKQNFGEVDCNWSKGTVENNEASGIIDGNYGKVENNLNGATINGNYGTVSNNQSGGTIKDNNFVVSKNEGNIEENAGQVVYNNFGGQIDINNNIVQNNSGTITENYGSVEKNTGTIENNYTSIDGYGGIVSENMGTVRNQWYEVALENNTTELRIESDDEIKDKGDTTTDVFVKRAASIIIYSLNPNKIIDAVAGGLEYVKNDDGSITINDIQNPLSIVTTLVDKFFEKKPHSDTEEEDEDDNDEDDEDVIKEDPSEKPVLEDPKTPASEPEKEEGDDNDDDDVVKEDPSDKPVVEDPKTPALEPEKEEGDDKGNDDVEKEDPAEDPIEDLILEVPEILTIPTQIITPTGAIDVATVVSENPTAAIKVAKTLKNDPVVVALAKELAAQMEEAIAANKELAIKELAETPNQAVAGSAEYEAKQTAISEDLANQIASINKLTVMSLAAVQKTGVSVSTGGCNKLEAANVSLLNDLLTKGVPVTLTYAIDGASVTLKIPSGVKLTKFIGADGRLDLTKLKRYIVK